MKTFNLFVALMLVALTLSVFEAVPTQADGDDPLCGYGVVTSASLNYGDGGWGGWSVPAGKVVTGGGFELTGGPAAVSVPGTPNSVWPHYTYGADEYGWVVRDAQDGANSPGSTVYAVYADEPAGYEIVTSPAMAFSDTGYGGWSCPAGKVVLGGGFESTGPVAVSAPGTPGSVWPHYTYGADEYGWVVQDAQDGAGNTITVYAICANMPTGYEVVTSASLNYGDGGWAGWSCPADKVVTGGGFKLTGGPAAVSAPGTPGSVWPHYTYGADEYGWVVRDAQDGANSPGSTVYAICASPCAPTAITLASFSAQAGDDGVTLAWETGTEVDNAGFNLYRALLQDGPYTKVNNALIAAQGDPVSGASYSFVDMPDYGTFYYKLEDVDYYGASTLHGPVRVTVARPLRRPLYRPTLPVF